MTKKSFDASVLPKMLACAADLIKRGDCVLVGFSGGPDSVCLLHFLNYLSGKKHFHLAALHVNHGLRGKEALADQRFSKAFCERFHIDFLTQKIKAKDIAKRWNLSPEHAARKGRYEALAKAAKQIGANKIALGHHLDDHVETILLNILRGTKAKGLAGIALRRPLNKTVEIIRPLLGITRPEVLAYLTHNHLTSVTDQSNFDDAFTRNWIRQQLLPMLESKQPQIRQHLALMAQEIESQLKPKIL